MGHLEQRHHHTWPKPGAPGHPHHSNPPGLHIVKGVAALLVTSMLLHAVEQCQGQDLVSNNTLPIETVGPHTPEDVKHLIHGMEHHARAHPSPFLVAGHAPLVIICRCLKISAIFVYMPPKMLSVFAKCGIEALPKDGSKPANKNQII